MARLSPSMIRSWENLGLTRPQRSRSKYRLYTPEDVKLLKRARYLRRVRGLNAPAMAWGPLRPMRGHQDPGVQEAPTPIASHWC